MCMYYTYHQSQQQDLLVQTWHQWQYYSLLVQTWHHWQCYSLMTHHHLLDMNHIFNCTQSKQSTPNTLCCMRLDQCSVYCEQAFFMAVSLNRAYLQLINYNIHYLLVVDRSMDSSVVLRDTVGCNISLLLVSCVLSMSTKGDNVS